MGNYFNNIKRVFCLFIILGQLVVLAGCPSNLETEGKNNVWQFVNFTYFNTVSYIYSYKGDEQSEFKENCSAVSELLEHYHKLFDIYHEYSGMTNLCTINKNAGNEALVVEQELIDFLIYAKEIYHVTQEETNVMLGPVLKLWHDARENVSNGGVAYIPSVEELAEANKYVDIELLEIDDENNTVRISDANGRIDVGALGKGYATEKAGQLLENLGCTSYVLNIGGNIRIVGTRVDGTGWNTGIKNPLNPSSYSTIINITDTSCVTSGDYERYFMYEGVKYHHIIDKDTLMPADHFASITIVVKDSGLADALSTALFSMTYEEGKELIDSIEGVEVVWIYKDGTMAFTDGIKKVA